MIGVLQIYSLALITNQGSAARTDLTYRAQQVVENLRMIQYFAKNGNVAPAKPENYDVATQASTTGTFTISPTGTATGTSTKQTLPDLAYGDGASQKLDLSIPDGAALPLPVVIRIHGGAFQGGSKGMEEGDAAATAILAQGYALVSLDYRLSGEAKFPAGAQDVKRAVRFLRANAAKYGLDTERFASWGESAGGWFAVMLGVTGDQSTVFDDASDPNAAESSAVQAVVDWFGPVDFATMDAQNAKYPPSGCTPQVHDPKTSPESAWIGGALTDAAVATEVAEANLPTYIPKAKALPRFVAAHGTADCNVPWAQSQELVDALTAVGNSATFTKLDGYSHGDPRFETTQVTPDLAILKEVFGR